MSPLSSAERRRSVADEPCHRRPSSWPPGQASEAAAAAGLPGGSWLWRPVYVVRTHLGSADALSICFRTLQPSAVR
uniref:Uncharacterized protein n=1 Tax=Oryza meridionalis TaxID=40149 RepID=A0A0E0D739_9ORYZ